MPHHLFNLDMCDVTIYVTPIVGSLSVLVQPIRGSSLANLIIIYIGFWALDPLTEKYGRTLYVQIHFTFVFPLGSVFNLL